MQIGKNCRNKPSAMWPYYSPAVFPYSRCFLTDSDITCCLSWAGALPPISASLIILYVVHQCWEKWPIVSRRKSCCIDMTVWWTTYSSLRITHMYTLSKLMSLQWSLQPWKQLSEYEQWMTLVIQPAMICRYIGDENRFRSNTKGSRISNWWFCGGCKKHE